MIQKNNILYALLVAILLLTACERVVKPSETPPEKFDIYVINFTKDSLLIEIEPDMNWVNKVELTLPDNRTIPQKLFLNQNSPIKKIEPKKERNKPRTKDTFISEEDTKKVVYSSHVTFFFRLYPIIVASYNPRRKLLLKKIYVANLRTKKVSILHDILLPAHVNKEGKWINSDDDKHYLILNE